LFTGQFSGRSTAALTMSLSCSSSSQLSNIWFNVCSPLLQEHIRRSLILKLYKYDLIFPCSLSIVVKFGIILNYKFKLSVSLGKYDFVIEPFVVLSHSPCHFVTLLSLNSFVTVFFGSFCSTQYRCWLLPLSHFDLLARFRGVSHVP